MCQLNVTGQSALAPMEQDYLSRVLAALIGQ